MVNLDSGRKLLKPAGGPHSGLHMFITQPWKMNVGICSTLIFAVRNISFSAYERLWPMLVPPLMTLLDDHSAKWRLRALAVGSQFLENVPPDLLRRTGMQDLLMKACFLDLLT